MPPLSKPIVLGAALTLFAMGLAGCTPLSLMSSAVSQSLGAGTAKIGWYDAASTLAQIEEIKKPSAPLNLTLDVRYIFQGYDTDAKGTVESTLDWAFSDRLTQQLTDILEKNGIALINDRGLDGDIHVEVSNHLAWFGQRYIPFLSGIRLTEEKLGKMRITLKNRKGETLVSDLVNEKLFVQSGIFTDAVTDESKQGVFDVPRLDYTVEGETVALNNLNEQLFLQTLRNLQQKADLEKFFATDPNPLPEEPPAEGQPAQDGQLSELEQAIQAISEAP